MKQAANRLVFKVEDDGLTYRLIEDLGQTTTTQANKRAKEVGGVVLFRPNPKNKDKA